MALIEKPKHNRFDNICEIKATMNYGSKLPYEVAKALFPDFDEDFAWRP